MVISHFMYVHITPILKTRQTCRRSQVSARQHYNFHGAAIAGLLKQFCIRVWDGPDITLHRDAKPSTANLSGAVEHDTTVRVST